MRLCEHKNTVTVPWYEFAYSGHYYYWAVVCADCSAILERKETKD